LQIETPAALRGLHPSAEAHSGKFLGDSVNELKSLAPDSLKVSLRLTEGLANACFPPRSFTFDDNKTLRLLIVADEVKSYVAQWNFASGEPTFRVQISFNPSGHLLFVSQECHLNTILVSGQAPRLSRRSALASDTKRLGLNVSPRTA